LNGPDAGERPYAELLRESMLASLNHGLRAPAASVRTHLRSVRDALSRGDVAAGLRITDRTWRCLPDAVTTVGPLYGRLLMWEGRDHGAALGLLRREVEATPNPDAAALIVVALLELKLLAEARRDFESALSSYCVDPDGLLACAGGKLLDLGELQVPGWMGRDPGLGLIGELAPAESAVLDIRIDGGAPLTRLLPHNGGANPRVFQVDAPGAGIESVIAASCQGRPLLGSGLRGRADFSLDGRIDGNARRITGWARLGWAPNQRLKVRIEDQRGRRTEVRTEAVRGVTSGGAFAIDLGKTTLKGNRFELSAELPDGRWQPLPNSPLLLAPALSVGRKIPVPLPSWVAGAVRRRRRSSPRLVEAVDIVIPVYGNREVALACIASVLATLGDEARLIVVDDASVDPALEQALDDLEADGRIQLLRNTTNLGFVGSANRGMQLRRTHDVVLLNSDTLVFGDWLSRLRAAAYSAANVGTVTPLSNNGSIASYPHREGSVLDAHLAAELHALAAATLSGTRVEIPVGVGFCLYIRRDCLREVGLLDAAVFAKGYGEETDFCMRARQRGWSHQLAADVFVYHAEGVSFAGRRGALLERSQRLLNLRYPRYDRFIASFIAQDPLHAARRALDERRLLAGHGHFVLLVTLALGGGVERFVAERCRALTAQGLVPLLLRPAAAGNRRRCELACDSLDLPNLQYDIPADLPALTTLLRSLRLERLELQHFLHLDARLIDALLALPVPYEVMVHDYSWICSRVTLIDGSDRYCGEPDLAGCARCIRRNGSKLGESIDVPALRQRSARWLAGARQVSAPSADAAARLTRYFPELSVDVRPHATPLALIPLAAPPAERSALRIALIGAIGTHKGYQVLLACARDARARDLPIEFVIIGYSEKDAPLLATGKVFVTGYYGEAEAPHILQRERPDIAWLPSVWPETWCYTLDYALAANLPVVAFDLGAIAERLQGRDEAELLPLALAPSAINDRLLTFAKRARLRDFTKSNYFESEMPLSHDHAKIKQQSMIEEKNGKHMIKTSNGKTKPKTAPADVPTSVKSKDKDEGLSATVQVLPLPSGIYLFSVKSAAPTSAGTGGLLSLPAMNVGLGPGVRSDQVEFIAGPSTHGAWLFSQNDLLVTKVNGTGATLILTSVRAAGGEVLSIGVERLDNRTDMLAARAEPVAAAPAKVSGRAAKNGADGAAKTPAQPVFQSTDGDLPLPVQIGTHIRTRGDLNFTNVPWAGRVAPGLWIESFSVRPLERFAPADIEYKGLTGSGFETPWLSDASMCGTKGMATPLVGFAIRLKPSAEAAAFDCEYSGYFQSGTTVGPLRNGAPCRSTVANDSLEGIQVRIVKRSATASTQVHRNVADEGSAKMAAGKAKPEAPKAGKKSLPLAEPKSVVSARSTRRA